MYTIIVENGILEVVLTRYAEKNNSSFYLDSNGKKFENENNILLGSVASLENSARCNHE